MKRLALLTAVILAVAGISSGCLSRPGEATPVQGSAPESSQEAREESGASVDPLANVNLVQFSSVAAGESIVVLETTMGTIRIRLFPDKAPKAVENFLGLAEQGYYNGKTFHRVVKDFMIQGGSLDGKGGGGTSIYGGQPYEREWSADLWQFRGAVSMVNTGEPNSTLSQFMIIQNGEVSEQTIADMRGASFPDKVIEKYIEVGGSPHLDTRYSIFGQVVEGMDVVDAIAALGGENEAPTEDVVILTATVTTA